jgi:hypothetical protein
MEQVCIKELFLSCRCYENFVSNLHFLCFLSNSKFFMIILLPHRLAAWLHRRLWCSTDGASMDWSFLHTLQKCTKRNSTTPFQPQSMVPWCIWQLDCCQGKQMFTKRFLMWNFVAYQLFFFQYQ